MTYKPVDTAIVMVVGPCIDDTDFKSLEEAIAYDAAGMDVSLIVEKTDGTTAVTAITLTTGGTSDWTHKDGGYYEVEVTAAQNAEEGIAYIRGVCTGVLPFESSRYNIVKANVYDSWIKGTDVLQTDITQIGGDAQSATDLKDFADAGYDPGTNKVQGVVLVDTTTTNTDLVSAAAVVNEWETQSQADPTGFHVNVLEIGGTAQTANDNGADINSIVTAVVPTTHCATSGTLNVGTQFSGSYADTCTDDSNYWNLLVPSGGAIDVEFGFGIGVNRVTTNVGCVIKGGGTGLIVFYAYNYLTSSWDQLNYSSYAVPSTSDVDYRFSMLQDHVDVAGSAKIKFVASGQGEGDPFDINMVNVRSINAGSITNGVKLGAQGQSDVNAEADTALTDYDAPTNTEMVDAFTEIKGATWASGSDTLEHIRDKQTDIETDTAEIGTAGAGLTDLGGMSTSMKAEVNAEADTALTDYDPPTDTEMIARTLPTADYVVTTDTIAGVTTTTNLTNAPTNGDLTATMKTSVNTEAKDVLTVDTISDSYATDGNQPTIAQAILAIQQMMQDKSISGTTLTVKKPDGSTTAMTFTLDSATTPTSITRAT